MTGFVAYKITTHIILTFASRTPKIAENVVKMLLQNKYILKNFRWKKIVKLSLTKILILKTLGSHRAELVIFEIMAPIFGASILNCSCFPENEATHKILGQAL